MTIWTPCTHVFPPIAVPAHWNVLEVVEPKNETARIKMPAIIPSRTAYSTALAPFSLRIALTAWRAIQTGTSAKEGEMTLTQKTQQR